MVGQMNNGFVHKINGNVGTVYAFRSLSFVMASMTVVITMTKKTAIPGYDGVCFAFCF